MLLMAVTLGALTTWGSPASAQDTVRFVVLGHIRGDATGPHPRLSEALAEARSLRPDFAVLTGDLIWGEVDHPTADPAVLERQWNALDSAVAVLGVPVFRVPGNHDISDRPSRDVWWRRYGPLPAVARVGDLRLVLLSSAWIPADSDRRHNPFIRGVDLDSSQVAWLANELRSPPTKTFVFLHHLLWWEPDDGRWWREVHPLLAAAGVDAVFSGDYGPLKFSTMERDRVRYFQSSIELPVSLPLLQNRLPSRLLSAQFDSFLEVVVAGGKADVRVHTVSEVSSGEFTPQRYHAINDPQPAVVAPLATRLWNAVGSPKRLAAVIGGILVLFGAGYLVGRRRTI